MRNPPWEAIPLAEFLFMDCMADSFSLSLHKKILSPFVRNFAGLLVIFAVSKNKRIITLKQISIWKQKKKYWQQ